ncbi:MAG: hypothetical protein HRT58_09805 [Crocinitomicaceae bacterium]|nr:hypothetical protein [Flavobacteriales bacterium]NQZ35949.1 hypothetical protein [Crocinitomicaceae bacterium]
MSSWKYFLYIITMVSFVSCSDSNYIEFNSEEKVIINLTDNYFIKSVVITEFVENNATIHFIDSNKMTITQHGGRAMNVINLLHLNTNYTAEGISASILLKKENLHFKIVMSKYEMWKLGMDSDFKIITFKSSDLMKTRTEFRPQ